MIPSTCANVETISQRRDITYTHLEEEESCDVMWNNITAQGHHAHAPWGRGILWRHVEQYHSAGTPHRGILWCHVEQYHSTGAPHRGILWRHATFVTSVSRHWSVLCLTTTVHWRLLNSSEEAYPFNVTYYCIQISLEIIATHTSLGGLLNNEPYSTCHEQLNC